MQAEAIAAWQRIHLAMREYGMESEDIETVSGYFEALAGKRTTVVQDLTGAMHALEYWEGQANCWLDRLKDKDKPVWMADAIRRGRREIDRAYVAISENQHLLSVGER